MKPIILASASPRRRDILTLAGIPFAMCPAAEEWAPEGLIPADRVLALARSKAEAVAKACPHSVILGADTMVVLGDRIFGKPKDEAEAVDMLLTLQGKSHQVMTGVWLVRTDGEGNTVKADGFTDIAEVTFFSVTPTEAADYVATGEPMDKAGAYALQGQGMRFVRGMQGDYYTVVGLPGGRLVRFLQDFAPDW